MSYSNSFFSTGFPYPPASILFENLPPSYKGEFLKHVCPDGTVIESDEVRRREPPDVGVCAYFGGYLIQCYHTECGTIKLVGYTPHCGCDNGD